MYFGWQLVGFSRWLEVDRIGRFRWSEVAREAGRIGPPAHRARLAPQQHHLATTEKRTKKRELSLAETDGNSTIIAYVFSFHEPIEQFFNE